ncbi:MAG: hypothetical protein KGZ74_06700 [Chitinophagaceae bacterium]|nr:hypothetical protein [Chitinophagaceae bacterium]
MNKPGYQLWDEYNGKKLLLIALSLVLLTHGIIIYFTLPKTYDAFVHIFFADHYSRFWFEPWEYRWYTGFLTTSYPPLVHQVIALISKVFPLKVAFSIYAILILEVLILGVYRFTKLFFDKTTAGIAAILTVILSSIVETLHVYGQMPTLTGLAFLLNALPFLYQYITRQKVIYLVMALAFLSVTVCSHHVTAIFGMVFFIAPVVFMALADSLSKKDRSANLFRFAVSVVKTGFKKYKEIIVFGILMLVLAIGLIFPYWYWSKTDPITQVSIPHGSRDNFFQKPSSGLIFFIIPLTLIFALLPAITYTITRQRRFIGWAAAFFLCLLFGSGGTTPLPKMMLGENAFNILTLDRFGFWASIIAIPFMAKFIYSFINGPVKDFWQINFSTKTHFILSGISGFTYLLFILFIFHLGSFRSLQPKEIDIQPMLNFLNRDEHIRWRYLTLGFGDQMAWLSANSLAATVDGNYHSARRLPELTTRPVERLENAKFNGDEGLASLNDFLTNSEKYSLKYVFSNDRYYDPLLYYSGWSRTIRLENGIMVWEKGNISTIKPMQPKTVSVLLKNAWGVFPVTSLCLTFLLTLIYLKYYKVKDYFDAIPETSHYYPLSVIYSSSLLPLIFFSGFMLKQVYELLLVKEQKDPRVAVLNYYNHLDFQRFEKAFRFFKPSPLYPLDQYLLEKSVNDGGLLPSYAKLDSISVTDINQKNDSAQVSVYTKWRTSLGYREKKELIQLVKQDKKWFILPSQFVTEIPEEQMRSYTYTFFKKQGKRVISSFPTVKDDRVKKPFAVFRQVNFIRDGQRNIITGEIINADDIPVNIGLKVVVHFHNSNIKEYHPGTTFQYNLSPKAGSFFQVELDSTKMLDRLKIKSIELYAETDVSERGYTHGGTPGYSVAQLKNNEVQISTTLYNELTTEINIPGILVAEKDNNGTIWQTQLFLHSKAVRSGLHINFQHELQKIQGRAVLIKQFPVQVFINGQPRTVLPTQKDEIANANKGIALLPHCFISQEIYLQ